MKQYFCLIALPLLLLLTSCEKELQLANSENGLMVLNGLIDSNEPFSVLLTKSTTILGDEPIVEIDDAQVSIFKDGSLVEELVFIASEDGSLSKYVGQTQPQPNTGYSIEVTHSKYGKVYSSTFVPSNPTVSHFQYERKQDLPSDLIKFDFSFTLDDSPNTDYYYVRMGMPVYRMENDTIGELYGFNPIEISDHGISGTNYLNKGFVFSDESFNSNTNSIQISGMGKTITWSHPYNTVSSQTPIAFDEINTLYTDTSKVIFRFEKLSYDTYLFYTSHAAYLETWNDDYAEPALIYSNIEDGLGLFGGLNRFEEMFALD